MPGFRRSKTDAIENKRWREFRSEYSRLIEEFGIPEEILEKRTNFVYFLEHGDLPGSAFWIDVPNLTEEQKQPIRKLVLAHYSAFGYPRHVCVLSPADNEKLFGGEDD